MSNEYTSVEKLPDLPLFFLLFLYFLNGKLSELFDEKTNPS